MSLRVIRPRFFLLNKSSSVIAAIWAIQSAEPRYFCISSRQWYARALRVRTSKDMLRIGICSDLKSTVDATDGNMASNSNLDVVSNMLLLSELRFVGWSSARVEDRTLRCPPSH